MLLATYHLAGIATCAILAVCAPLALLALRRLARGSAGPQWSRARADACFTYPGKGRYSA